MKLIDMQKVTETLLIADKAARDALGVEHSVYVENEETLTFAEVKVKNPEQAEGEERDVYLARCAEARANVLNTIAKDLNPLYVLKTKLNRAVAVFAKTDGEEKDVAAFKRAFHLAQAECVNAYKAEGNSTAVDYLKAAGLALLGALVAIIASPLLAFSADKRTDLVNTFFSGVETDRSKLAQTEMKADAAGDLLEEVAAPANN